MIITAIPRSVLHLAVSRLGDNEPGLAEMAALLISRIARNTASKSAVTPAPSLPVVSHGDFVGTPYLSIWRGTNPEPDFSLTAKAISLQPQHYSRVKMWRNLLNNGAVFDSRPGSHSEVAKIL